MDNALWLAVGLLLTGLVILGYLLYRLARRVRRLEREVQGSQRGETTIEGIPEGTPLVYVDQVTDERGTLHVISPAEKPRGKPIKVYLVRGVRPPTQTESFQRQGKAFVLCQIA